MLLAVVVEGGRWGGRTAIDWLIDALFFRSGRQVSKKRWLDSSPAAHPPSSWQSGPLHHRAHPPLGSDLPSCRSAIIRQHRSRPSSNLGFLFSGNNDSYATNRAVPPKVLAKLNHSSLAASMVAMDLAYDRNISALPRNRKK